MEELVALAGRARDGDRAALEELLHASAGLVHAIARSRLGESLAADGAAADALAHVARGVKKLRDAQAYAHWLYRIAVRSASTARGRTPRTVDPAHLDTLDPGGGPVETLVAAERAQRVRKEIQALSPRLREPVYLHFVEGLTYREVGRVLDIGGATVSRRIHRALAVLKSRLGGAP